MKHPQMSDASSSPWGLAAPAGLVAFLLLLTTVAGAVADPQAGPAGAPFGPDNWQQWWVPITTSATGDRVFLLETVVYRPSGDGPFPLVTINHGKPRGGEAAARSMHPGYDRAAGWFVDHGFAVAVPMRAATALHKVRSAISPETAIIVIISRLRC